MARSITNWDKFFEAVDGGYVFRKYPFSRGVFMNADTRTAFEAFMNAAILRRLMEVALLMSVLLSFIAAAPAGALRVLEWGAVPLLVYVVLYTLFLMDRWTDRLERAGRPDAPRMRESLLAPPVAAGGFMLYFLGISGLMILVAFTNVGILFALPVPGDLTAFHWQAFWTGLPFNLVYLAGLLFLITRVKGGCLRDLPANRLEAVFGRGRKQTTDVQPHPAHDPARRGAHMPFLGRRRGRMGRR